jgi:hypothetical protein
METSQKIFWTATVHIIPNSEIKVISKKERKD